MGATEQATQATQKESPAETPMQVIERRAKAVVAYAQQKDADAEMVERALEMARAFIVARRRILFGGLALDYAAQHRGARVYPAEQRPDFDVYTPRHVDDAYDLAVALQEAGFEGASAVRGIHVQTMKVRVDFVWVADFGYVPQQVYDAIPTFDHLDMRVVHPDFQRMDMHLAFCYPFNAPPREDVFHRWRKDSERLALLDRIYPVGREPAPIRPPLRANATPLSAAAAATFACEVAGEEPVLALHGFAAYAAYRLAYAARYEYARPVKAPLLSLAIGRRYLAVEAPLGDRKIVAASPWPQLALPDAASFLAPYMDVAPLAFTSPNAVVYSTANRLLATNRLPVDGLALAPLPPGVEPPTPGAFVHLGTPHFLLNWLLYEAHRAPFDCKAAYREFYAHTLEIFAAAALAEKEADPARAVDAIAEGPFSVSVRTIGDANYDLSHAIKTAAAAAKIGDPYPDELLAGLPVNFYPSPGKARPAFDYFANPLFIRDGSARDANPLAALSHPLLTGAPLVTSSAGR